MGCRPYWLPVDPSPACETSGQVYRHLASYRHLSMLDGGSLVTETQCRRPCTFMEYKVQGLDCLLTAMYCGCAQLAEDPVFVNLAPGHASETRLTVVLVSSSMEVKREEAAYSALTLVADCGGLLGLFIGFNFLMIWDLVVIVGIKIAQYFNTLIR